MTCYPSGPQMKQTTGRAAFLQLLADEGVTHLFGNPGTTELAIMEAVPQFPQLKFVLGLLDETVEMDLGRPVRVDAAVRPADDTLGRVADMLMAAKRPAILAGQELALRDAFAEAAELAELVGAAVYGSSIPYSAQFPTEHAAFMGALTRQQKQVRATLEAHDLLLVLGADLLRMSVYSPVEPLPPGLPVIHVSERAHELGKNYRTDIAVHADVKQTLRALLPLLKVDRQAAQRRLSELKAKNWSAQRDKARIDAMLA